MKRFYAFLWSFLCVFSFSALANSTEGTSIDIKEIAPGVWTHTSYYIYPNGVRFPSNGLIIKNGEALTLIDTAWGEIQTTQLLTEIKKTLDLPVSHALVTHAHSDRAAGVDVLEAQGIEVIIAD